MARARTAEGRRLGVEVAAGVGLAALGLGICGWLFGDVSQPDGQPVPGSGDTGPDNVDCMTTLRGMPPDIQQAINPWDTFPGFEDIGIDFTNFGEVQGGQADLFNTEDGKFQVVLIQAEMRDQTSGEMQTSPVTFLGIRDVNADGNCRPVDEIFLLAPGPQLQIPPEDGVGIIKVVDQVDGIRINFDEGNNWQVDNERIPLLNLPRNDQGLPAAVLLIDENGGRHQVDTKGTESGILWGLNQGLMDAAGKLLAIDAEVVEAAPEEEVSPPPADTLELATSIPALSTPRSGVDPLGELLTERAADGDTPEPPPTEKPTAVILAPTAVVAPPPVEVQSAPPEAQPPPELQPTPESCWVKSPGGPGDTESCFSDTGERLSRLEKDNIILVQLLLPNPCGAEYLRSDDSSSAIGKLDARLRELDDLKLPTKPAWLEYIREPLKGEQLPWTVVVWVSGEGSCRVPAPPPVP